MAEISWMQCPLCRAIAGVSPRDCGNAMHIDCTHANCGPFDMLASILRSLAKGRHREHLLRWQQQVRQAHAQGKQLSIRKDADFRLITVAIPPTPRTDRPVSALQLQTFQWVEHVPIHVPIR